MKFFLIAFLLLMNHARSQEILRVGMELSYPPFEMICQDAEPCGVSVALAKKLGEFLDRPVQIENISFVGLIPALKAGKIDLILSSLTVTKEREKAIDFSIPYAKTGLCLLINSKSKVENIEDADTKGKVLVVKSATTAEMYALKNLRQATIRVLDKESLCVLEVIQGKADAFIYDQLSVYTNWKKNPKTLRANLTPFHEESWAIGIKKGNETLLNKVNQFIKEFRSDGGFDRLSDSYLAEQKAAFQKLKIPFIF